jgi:signal peptidase I
VNRRTLGCLFELAETFLITLVIFMLVQLFVAQPFQMQKLTMGNALKPGQFVLVDKLTPHFDDLHRGDIVVFNPPPGSPPDPSGTPYAERVIGAGGDTIDIHGGHVYLNGAQLTEAYVLKDQKTAMPDGGNKTWKLKADQVFVLGDNRQDPKTKDSRDFGPVDKSSVIGRVWLRYWPFSQFGLIPQSKQPPAPSGSPVSSTAP